MAHVVPVFPVEQVHMHAVLSALIATDVARPLLQCAATLHWMHELGYQEMRPTAQEAHVAPVYPDKQVHTHAVLAALMTTEDAWLLQCKPKLHWTHAEP